MNNQDNSKKYGWGGPREGAGRKHGSKGRTPAEVREYAGQYTIEMLEVMVKLARHGETERIRLEAADKILDRALGKPQQQQRVEGEINHSWQVVLAGKCQDEQGRITYHEISELENEPEYMQIEDK